MNIEKSEYECPHYEMIVIELGDIITTSAPDFDGGQSGLSF